MKYIIFLFYAGLFFLIACGPDLEAPENTYNILDGQYFNEKRGISLIVTGNEFKFLKADTVLETRTVTHAGYCGTHLTMTGPQARAEYKQITGDSLVLMDTTIYSPVMVRQHDMLVLLSLPTLGGKICDCPGIYFQGP